MADLAVLSIFLSFLRLSTASDSAGGEMDPSSILLQTIRDIATNMAVNQLAILRLLSDPPTPGQAVLQQCKNETQALEARINQYEIQLNQTGQAVLQQWNEAQAASEALEARINQNEIQLSQTRVAANETQEEVLQQCRREVQTATASLETKIQQIINHIQNITDRQEVPQESQGDIQEATTTLPVQINQTAIQFPESDNTWNDIGTSSCSGIKELCGTSGILELTSDMYTSNKDCEWTIVAPEGSVLDIHWLSFHLEDSTACDFDWIKVVDLYRPNELINGKKLCGSPGFLNASSWMTSGNKLKVTFHSDGSRNVDGFKLRFQALQTIPYGSTQQRRQLVLHNDTVPSTCSGNKVLECTWGQLALTSYTHNKDCSWVVETPPGSVITLRWLQFSLEQHDNCNYDWVKVTDLTRPSTLVYGKKLCGTSEFLLGRALTVATNRIRIAFHSDGSNVGQGFRLEYQAVQMPTTD